MSRVKSPRPGQTFAGYLSFRCKHGNIAQGAGTCVKVMFDMHKQGKGMGYDAIGAVKSIFGGPGKAKTRNDMDDLFDRILAGRSHRFFCSQLVAFVHQFVAEQNGMSGQTFFNLSDAKVPPATLAALLAPAPVFR